MRRVLISLAIISILILGVGCEKSVLSKGIEIIDTYELEELALNINVETEEVETGIILGDVSLESSVDEEEIMETYNLIGSGYFYSEPFDNIYPQINEDEEGMYIHIVNSEDKKYLILAVTSIVESPTVPHLRKDCIEIEFKSNEKVYITDELADELLTYIIYYLYEVEQL